MAPTRKPTELRDGDKFGSNFFDAAQTKIVKSDGARKLSAHKWTNLNMSVRPSLFVREVEKFDCLKWKREGLRHGQGSSSLMRMRE